MVIWVAKMVNKLRQSNRTSRFIGWLKHSGGNLTGSSQSKNNDVDRGMIWMGLVALLILGFVLAISWFGAGMFASEPALRIELFSGLSSIFLTFGLIWVYLSIAQSERTQAGYMAEQAGYQETAEDIQKEQLDLTNRQTDIQDEQAKIMEQQSEILRAQYRAELIEVLYKFSPTEYAEKYPDSEFRYSGVISNVGKDLAKDLFFRFDIYIDEAVDDVDGYDIVENPARSNETFRSISDMIFTDEEYAATRASWEDSVFRVPFRVDYARRIGGPFVEMVSDKMGGVPDDMEMTSVSVIQPGDDPMWFDERISFEVDYLENSLSFNNFCDLPEILDVLLKMGFSKVYFWIGIEYLDINSEPHSKTLQNRTLKLKSHYVEQPFYESGYYRDDLNVYSELNKLREENPHHPDLNA